MTATRVINGNTDAVWQQIEKDFLENPLLYNAEINLDGHKIMFSLYTDLGTDMATGIPLTSVEAPYITDNFMTGYSQTSFSSIITKDLSDFTFAIHHENFIDKVGKFLGMSDVNLGYQEFDKNLIVKTNNKEKLTQLFSNTETREVLSNLYDFRLYFASADEDDKNQSLEFESSPAIINLTDLRNVFEAFIDVLSKLEAL